MAKILLVDDDPLLIRMYQKKFQLDDHEVVTANDGTELFDKLEEFTPDVVLLDVMMPEMDGLTALKKLKADESYKKIPVIMLTNVGSSEKDSDEALEYGAVAYLVKANYSPKEIVQKVKEIIAGYTRDLPEVKTKIKDTSKKPNKVSKQTKSKTANEDPMVTVEDL